MNTAFDEIPPAPMPRPGYRIPVVDTGFNTQITRIANDTNRVIDVTGGKWGLRSRQHYSKDQTISDDGNYLKLQQKSGDPSNLIVNAHTYDPLWSDRGKSPAEKLLAKAHETRWRPGHGSQIVSVEKVSGKGIDVVTFDVRDGKEKSRLRVMSEDAKFGWQGEGQISDDGRWTVFTTLSKSPKTVADYIVIVDLERGRVGPRCDVSYATRAFPTSVKGVIGNCGISCLGNFAELKLSGTEQYSFVLDIDHDSLAATRRTLNLDALRMGPAEARGLKGASLGATAWLSHPDMNISMDGREVIVGGGRGFEKSSQPKASKEFGNVLMVDLKTGEVTHVSPGTTHLNGARAASMQHGSGRAYKRRGWHLCSFEIGNPSQWGAGEIMWVRLGSAAERAVQRVCHHRSAETGNYDAEAHPVASPDGRKVVFASNWKGAGAKPAGPAAGDVKCYVAV